MELNHFIICKVKVKIHSGDFMKNRFNFWLLFTFGLSVFPLAAEAGTALAKMAMPLPPAENPHPPKSAEEIKIVKFAEQAAQDFLMNNPPVISKNTDASAAFNQATALQNKYGLLVEFRHAHIIPWSMKRMNMRSTAPDREASSKGGFAPILDPDAPPELKADEFMVHMYVKFEKSPAWYHLDVILAKDPQGKISLRGFYAIPIPSSGGKLPPGAVC